MSLTEADWQRLLPRDSNLPPDVFFLVNDEDSEGEEQSKKIAAHRFLLAVVSPTFNAMFFGPVGETRKEIEVKETTFEAFNTMVKYIYNPLGEDPFNLDHIGCPQKLFELLTLANRYQLARLTTIASEALESLAITRENMIFSAMVAKKYKGTLFNDVSSKLTMRCLKFLLDTTRGGGDNWALITETVDNFPGANLDILRELIDVGRETLQLSGWGNLVFFDTEEHQIRDKLVAKIPKLESMWRIIHDFKPTEYLQARPLVSLLVCTGDIWRTPGSSFVYLCFPFPHICLANGICNDNNQVHLETDVIMSTQLPKVGEWTRLEIGHEKVDEKYFLFLSVGGVEVGRKEVTDPGLRNLTDVEVCLGGSSALESPQPGFIRRLVILDKQ